MDYDEEVAREESIARSKTKREKLEGKLVEQICAIPGEKWSYETSFQRNPGSNQSYHQFSTQSSSRDICVKANAHYPLKQVGLSCPLNEYSTHVVGEEHEYGIVDDNAKTTFLTVLHFWDKYQKEEKEKEEKRIEEEKKEKQFIEELTEVNDDIEALEYLLK